MEDPLTKKYIISTTEILKSKWIVEAEDKIEARKILFSGTVEPETSEVSSVYVDSIEEEQDDEE